MWAYLQQPVLTQPITQGQQLRSLLHPCHNLRAPYSSEQHLRSFSLLSFRSVSTLMLISRQSVALATPVSLETSRHPLDAIRELPFSFLHCIAQRQLQLQGVHPPFQIKTSKNMRIAGDPRLWRLQNWAQQDCSPAADEKISARATRCGQATLTHCSSLVGRYPRPSLRINGGSFKKKKTRSPVPPLTESVFRPLRGRPSVAATGSYSSASARKDSDSSIAPQENRIAQLSGSRIPCFSALDTLRRPAVPCVSRLSEAEGSRTSLQPTTAVGQKTWTAESIKELETQAFLTSYKQRSLLVVAPHVGGKAHTFQNE